MSRPARPPALALAAAAAALVALCFAQAPGKLTFDTKFDLVQDPSGFLSRATHLWDPTSGFGQLQNQAVGYMFPMGPFYAAAHALGVPMWIAQRAWIALILVVAMWGMARLAAALEVGRPAGWVLAGLAYALSPFFVGLVGFTSAGVLPAALLPWAVLPLVKGAREGSPRRAAALSGLAILLMGGVNATSLLAVLPLPAIFLLTRPPGARRRALMGWWAGAVVLACAWWAVALVFQGRYGIKLTDYTETAELTTSTTSLAEALRGTGNWLGYLNVGTPWVPASWRLVSSATAIAATAVLAAAGFAGLASRGLPERRFVVSALGVGAVAVCAGYSGRLGGAVAGPVQSLLNGGLAPFRNVYKFEPLLRVPLALGLAHVVSGVRLPSVRRPLAVVVAGATALTTVAAIALGALPWLQGNGTTAGSFERLPTYWSEVSGWLGERAARENTILLPGSAFGEYTWGRPLDEPIQALQRGPWVTRNLQPLGGVASVRLLDGIERLITNRRPAPGLRAALRRTGVRFILVRNDLDWRRTASPRPVQVREMLRRAGLRRVARFGPRLPRSATTRAFLPDLGVGRQEQRLSAVEIYAVDRRQPPVSSFPAASPDVISGGPESVLQLADDGRVGRRAGVLAADLSGPLPASSRWTVTDALRRNRSDFGLTHDSTSFTLTARENAPGKDTTPQLLPAEQMGHEAVATSPYEAGSITASSYGSWLLQLPELQPANAFDGVKRSAWVAGRAKGSEGQWVQATLPRAPDVRDLSVRLLREGPFRPRIVRLEVTTDRGSVTTEMADGEQPQPLRVVPGRTGRIRVTIAKVDGERPGEIGAGLRDVSIPGVRFRRFVAPPQERELLRQARARGINPTFLFSRATADLTDVLRADEERSLRRQFVLPVAGRLTVTGLAVPAAGAKLDALLTRTRGIRARASSTYNALPRYSAPHAFDGTRNTSWIAAPPSPGALPTPSAPGLNAGTGRRGASTSPVPNVVDPAPALRIAFAGPKTLRSVRVAAPESFAATPRTMRISAPSGTREVRVLTSRLMRFAALRTDRVTITFPRVEQRYTNGPDGRRALLPVGVSEIDFPALRPQRVIPLPPSLPVATGCGGGPALIVDGRELRTRLTATAGQATALDTVPLRLCGAKALALGAGRHLIRAASGGAFAVNDLRLEPAGEIDPPAGRGRSTTVLDWGPTRRRVRVGAGPATLLELHQNSNAGWQATLDGRRLEPRQLDGWQQGFLVPGGAAGVVRLDFAPDRPFRIALVVGGVLALLLLPLALLPGRRRGADEETTMGETPQGPGRRHLGWAAAAAVAMAVVCWPAPIVVPVLVWLGRRHAWLLAAVAGACLLAAGVVTAVAESPLTDDQRGAFGWPAQALAALALAAVLSSLAAWPRAASEAVEESA